MKKIILYILLFFIPVWVFADNTLKLSASSEKVKIGEAFQLTFTIESTGSVDIWKVEVDWITLFNNLWTSKYQNFVMMNGETKISYSYSLSLEWITQWTFVVWPVKATINNLVFTSNTVQVTVGNEELISTGSTTSKLHDVPKWVFQKINFSKFFIYLWLISFFVLFFFLLKIFFWKKENREDEKNEEIKEEIPFNEYIKNELLLLKKNTAVYNDKEFFERFNTLIRLYIGNAYSIENVWSRTLSELSSVIVWTSLASLFNESYIIEYSSTSQVEIEQKRAYIRDFLKLL